MGKRYATITPELQAWLGSQKAFFVATAPLDRDGHVNCSPKDAASFRVLGENEVAYHDLTGSGIETVAHLRENGRVVLMFCAFEGPPKIVRLHGRGVILEPADAGFPELAELFPPNAGTRTIIRVILDRITDSCGYGVPLYDFVERRDTLDRYSEKKGSDGMVAYRRANNSTSIDGLPGLRNV